MNDEHKDNSPFELPEMDSNSRDEKTTLRGDRLGLWAYRISIYAKLLIPIGFCFLNPLVVYMGAIILILWLIGEVIAILVAITSLFSPASSRKAAYSALLLSGFTLAVVIGLYFEMRFLEEM